MFRNYLKVAFRNILRHKGFSFINVLGLALGMAVSMLLLLWAQDELQFDKFHDNLDNIYQISMINEDTSPATAGRTTPNKLVPVILENFPEVKNAARIHSINDLILSYENKTFQENNFLLAESNFLEMFSFSLIEGDMKTALKETTSIILTRSSAEKFFGDTPAMGKSIMINNSVPFMVTGIIEDCPEKSTIYFDYILPFSVTGGQGDPWSWGSSSFIELHDNISIDSFREKFKTALVDYSPRDLDTDMLYLQSFSRVHLFGADDKPAGMNLVYIFSAIGLIILFIACINFVNLTTARSVKRAREVGVRKVVGAQKNQIIKQFLFESVMITSFAMAISLVLIELLLPEFNELTGKTIQFQLNNHLILLGFPSLLFFTGIISGIYPALFLSSYKPVKVFKAYFSNKTMRTFRKALVVFQFTISVALIILTFVMVRQLNYINNKDLGLKKDSIISLQYYSGYTQKIDTIKEELLKNPNIEFVSVANSNPASVKHINSVSWEGKDTDDRFLCRCIYTNADYLKMFEIPFVAGGNFQKERADHPDIEYIINETAVVKMGLTDPIGKKFSMGGDEGYIVGVVKDFHNRTLNQNIQPQLITQLDWFQQEMFIRIKPVDAVNSLKYIENKLADIAPGYPFDFSFVDESIENQYGSIQRTRSIMSYFAVLAMFISGLGLFGLSSYIAEQRSKEVSIRKIFGSSIKEVITLLTGKFLLWVAIATIIAFPLALYISNVFLKRFVYHIDLSFLDFAIPIAAQFIVAFLSVSFNTLKAAMSNPAKALQYE